MGTIAPNVARPADTANAPANTCERYLTHTGLVRPQCAQWVVRVAPAGGWTSNYYGGLIAAVVVLAFALSVFLFAALVLWRRHQMLLSALLPRKVIRDLHNAGGAALAGACSRMVLNTGRWDRVTPRHALGAVTHVGRKAVSQRHASAGSYAQQQHRSPRACLRACLYSCAQT